MRKEFTGIARIRTITMMDEVDRIQATAEKEEGVEETREFRIFGPP